MSLLSSGRLYKQKAVYWPYTGLTSLSGKKAYGDPVVTVCRWEDRTQTFLSASGQTKVSRAIVYLPFAPVADSYLWLSSYKKKDSDNLVMTELVLLIGAQGGQALLNQPDKIIGAWQINRIDQIPDLRAKQTLRICIL